MTAGNDRERLRAALPDIPRWVETRDLLSHDECPIYLDPSAPEDPSFVVVDDARGRLASVVGCPAMDLIESAASGSDELLAFPENIRHVRNALPEWAAERAVLHSLPGWRVVTGEAEYPTRRLESGEVSTLAHVDTDLRVELQEAESAGIDIVTALDDSLPVAFCYAGATTERLWDVAIDTVPSHRRRGYARSVVLRLIRAQAERGLAPVWGGLESNRASLRLAKKLGFREIDSIWVLTPLRGTLATPSNH